MVCGKLCYIFGNSSRIDEADLAESIVLYPNLSSSYVHLNMGNNAAPSKVVIRNLAGEIVYQDISGASSFSIDNFSNGVYLVTIETSDSELTLRFIKN